MTRILAVASGDSSKLACPPSCHLAATVGVDHMHVTKACASVLLGWETCPKTPFNLWNEQSIKCVHLSLPHTQCYWLGSCSKIYVLSKATKCSDLATDSWC